MDPKRTGEIVQSIPFIQGLFDDIGITHARVCEVVRSSIPSHCSGEGMYRWKLIGFKEHGDVFIVEMTNHKGDLIASVDFKITVKHELAEQCAQSLAPIFKEIEN